ncbi:MAG TPA: type 2 isopentenyl-diphosphate Delta-isomerase [Euryarchaeota archaeon]|nr:type 2 isopentenyl-diphosphate Delta-isomerase [Euryarchaeota archaeon]
MNDSNQTEKRKSDHIEICSTKDVTARYNFWDDISLVHLATPEIDYEEIDTQLRLFGCQLSAPIVISGMTGGTESGKKINASLAKAASDLQVGMGVGSQRAAIEKTSLSGSYEVLRDFDIPLKLANIGAPQLVMAGSYKHACEMVGDAMDMIEADLIAVHLNYLQEAVQPEGEKRAKGLLSMIRDLAIDFPVIVKETGCGMSPELIETLSRMKVKGVDVGGAGGTSFSAVEYYRSQEVGDRMRARLGRTFWDWGIPTPVSAAVASLHFPTIATGGVRNGLDVARAVVVGANTAGIANRLLAPAIEGEDSAEAELREIIEELKVAMFLTGSKNVKQLSEHDPLVSGPTRDWVEHLVT